MKNIVFTIFEVIKTFAIVLIVAFLLRKVVVQPFVVEGSSMEPNFHNSEYLLVDQLSYRFHQPKRGDVIIFKAPTNPNVNYIKRVIGLPGETVEIKSGKVYINSKLLDESFLKEMQQTLIYASKTKGLTTTLGEKELFVMGDNRDNSSDSREWGTLPEQNIIGRVFLIVYPFDNFRWQSRPTLELSLLSSPIS